MFIIISRNLSFPKVSRQKIYTCALMRPLWDSTTSFRFHIPTPFRIKFTFIFSSTIRLRFFVLCLKVWNSWNSHHIFMGPLWFFSYAPQIHRRLMLFQVFKCSSDRIKTKGKWESWGWNSNSFSEEEEKCEWRHVKRKQRESYWFR